MSVSLFAVSLEGLIEQALKHSTVIKKSEAQMKLSRMKREASRAKQFGQIDLVGSYTHFNLPRTLAPLTPAVIATGAQDVTTTKDLYSAGVVYSVPLFTGFAQTKQIEMDRIAEAMAQSKLSLSKEQLAYNVASLYLSVLALREMQTAQKAHVRALRLLTKRVEDEVALGKKAKVDLLKAQKDLYANIAYEEVIKANIETAKASLAALVGVDRIGTLQKVKVSVKKPRYSLDALMAKTQRLEKMKIAEYSVKKAQKGVEKSRSALLPQVSLTSYYGYNYGENDPTQVNPNTGWDNEKTWQIGLNAKWTVFDFGKSDATVEQAKIARIEAELQKRQTLLDLKKALVEARETINRAYANYIGNRKQYRLAKKSEEIERVRYENGVSTMNDLLYAASQKQLAKARLIESKYNYQKGKFYMDYLLERGVSRLKR